MFTINQRQVNKRDGESCVPFMQNLANFFDCELNYKVNMNEQLKKPSKAVSFFVQSDKKHQLVTSYFNRYPLMSSKRLNYLSYVKSLNYLGKRLTKEEISEIRDIKNSMNTKRTEFN